MFIELRVGGWVGGTISTKKTCLKKKNLIKTGLNFFHNTFIVKNCIYAFFSILILQFPSLFFIIDILEK